jgi:Mrp family chromosome partitioning ATPase
MQQETQQSMEIRPVGHSRGYTNGYSMNEQVPSPAWGALTRPIATHLENIPDDVLQTVVHAPHLEVLGVTSSLPGEGKSTIALQLAASVARYTFKKVCLIDLSLNAKGLTSWLGAESESGVVDAIEQMDYRLSAMKVPEHDDLIFLPAGKMPDNAERTAYSPALNDLLTAARQTFDVVIVDMPSVQSGLVLPMVRHTDKVLFVIQAGLTPRDLIKSDIETIGRERVLGAVLNRTKSKMPRFLQKWLRPF